MDKIAINIGMIGTGFMCKAHSNAYNTIPYMFIDRKYSINKLAIGDISVTAADCAARRYGYTKGLEGWQAVVDDNEIDVVDICTGDDLHKEIAIEAIKRNKHVICEKPLSNNVEDAKEMYIASKNSKVKTMCGFNYRFFPAVRLAKNLIENGVIGRLYSFSGRYCQDSGAYEDTPMDKVWYALGSKGSGVALGIGTHLIDMSRYFLGEVSAVNGLSRTHIKTRDLPNGGVGNISVDDESLALLEFENGCIADIKISGVAAGRKNQLAFEISGSKGGVYYDIEDPNLLYVFTKETQYKEVTGFTKINVTQLDKNHPYADIWWPRGHAIGWEHAHINEIEYFLSSISDNTSVSPFGATFEDGYKATAVCCAILDASDSGKKIIMQY